MVAVFGAFALSSVVLIKALGFSMAVAVLIDATLVRGVLVPAFMRIMGSAHWWAPRWIQRGVAPASDLRGPAPGARPGLTRVALLSMGEPRASLEPHHPMARTSRCASLGGSPRGRPRREDVAARAFPFRSMSPAAYVAEDGTDMTGFTYDEATYRDPELDAWLLEVGRLLRMRR